MTAQELRDKFLYFMKEKGHAIVPSASLIPENDASTLFISAGMHPLVPYLMGEKHPNGKRIANVQKCVRTGDIDEVGDNRHLTFFEMMGNWSFGDYFKKESISWSFEFLTDKEKGLGLDPERLYVTVFKGEDGISRDEESIEIWKEVFKEKAGMEVEVAKDNEMISKNVRIFPLGKEDNFWIAGETGPCGGDTEIFYDTCPEEGKLEGKFSDLVDDFRLLEIWNNVFMEFNKTHDGKYKKLEKNNVDTGMGVERTLAVLNEKETVFETELFEPIIQKISQISGKKYEKDEEQGKSFRIIADHLRSASFILSDGVLPGNTDRGYILRRLIRRAIRHGKVLGIENSFTSQVLEVVIEEYGDFYCKLQEKKEMILKEIEKEEEKFRKTLERGEKIILNLEKINGKEAFNLFQTYGYPIEITKEIAKERNIKVDSDLDDEFQKHFQKHQELSRTAAAGKFKGGLADDNEETIKLHTAAHLLLEALRRVLGDHIEQKGSNINGERLRFDFSHNQKMTDEEKQEVEKMVNEQIEKGLPVSFSEMSLSEAKAQGATGVFESKYGEKVKVYTVGESLMDSGQIFSREICGGPHVENTSELGRFKIKKEKSSSAGVRRIKAVLE